MKTVNILAALLLCLCGSPSRAEPAAKPKISFVLFDDMGYGQPKCCREGAEFKTPNIDRLAREGMRFTDAHSAASVCTPTRYGVVTGRYATVPAAHTDCARAGVRGKERHQRQREPIPRLALPRRLGARPGARYAGETKAGRQHAHHDQQRQRGRRSLVCPFHGAKTSIYEGGHREPFLARWAGKIKAGAVCDDTICLNDLMATCAEIIGANLPDNAGEMSVDKTSPGKKKGKKERKKSSKEVALDPDFD